MQPAPSPSEECALVIRQKIGQQLDWGPSKWTLAASKSLHRRRIDGGQGWGRTAVLPISRPSPSRKMHPVIVGIQWLSHTQAH